MCVLEGWDPGESRLASTGPVYVEGGRGVSLINGRLFSVMGFSLGNWSGFVYHRGMPSVSSLFWGLFFIKR